MASPARAIRRTGSLREQTSYRASQAHSKYVDNLNGLSACCPQVIHRLLFAFNIWQGVLFNLSHPILTSITAWHDIHFKPSDRDFLP
jgi:hypothetical protein